MSGSVASCDSKSAIGARYDRQPAMTLTKAEFDQLFASVSNWGRWGPDDQRGTLNLITAERVTAAAALVRRGYSVSLSYLLSKVADIDNPKPMLHYMSRLTLGMPGEPK